MELLLLLAGFIVLFCVLVGAVGVASYIVSWIVVVTLFAILGLIFYSIFGWQGVAAVLGFCFLVDLIKRSIRGSSKRTSSKKSLKDLHKLDEELEDYDYLDNMTGRDDKPWM